jgi:hypothetical protein
MDALMMAKNNFCTGFDVSATAVLGKIIGKEHSNATI